MYVESIKTRSMGGYITIAVVLPIIFTIISIFSLLFGAFGVAFSTIAWLGNLICSIAVIVIWHGIIKDINVMCKGDGEELNGYIVAILLGVVTLGIYLLYYNYRVQTRLHENAARYNRVISETGTTYLLVTLLGMLFLGVGPFIGQLMIFNNFNKLASGYNDAQIPDGINYDEDVFFTEDDNSSRTVTIPGSMRLLCENGEYQGGSFDVFQGETLSIGRSNDFSNIVLKEEGVSRKHCELRFTDKGLLLKDTSSNGTFLNGQQIESGKYIALHNGDKIKIGRTNNIFSVRI